MTLTKPCLQCGKTMTKRPNRSLKDWNNRTKYCSRECGYKHFPNTNEFRRKQSEAHKGQVVVHSGETKRKISRSLWKGGKPKCGVCDKQLSTYSAKHCKVHRPITMRTRLKRSIATKGSKAHAWKGGITPINRAIRGSLQYRIWRKEVFTRDKYTCVLCGKIGGNIHADHIKQFAYHPELRFEISNGRTLCVACHKNTATYKRKI